MDLFTGKWVNNETILDAGVALCDGRKAMNRSQGALEMTDWKKVAGSFMPSS